MSGNIHLEFRQNLLESNFLVLNICIYAPRAKQKLSCVRHFAWNRSGLNGVQICLPATQWRPGANYGITKKEQTVGERPVWRAWTKYNGNLYAASCNVGLRQATSASKPKRLGVLHEWHERKWLLQMTVAKPSTHTYIQPYHHTNKYVYLSLCVGSVA